MSVLLISMRVCQGCKFVETPKAGRITRARRKQRGGFSVEHFVCIPSIFFCEFSPFISINN